MKVVKLLSAVLLSALLAVSSWAADTATKSLSLVVNAAVVTITPATLPQGMVGLVYTGVTVSATGGVAPYTFSISVGALPAGLTISSTTGAITGTPTTAGSVTFTVKVADSEATPATATQSYTVNILSALTITTTSLAAANIGVAYSTTLTATGGTAPYTWAITTGSLPAGLTLNPATGAITGTPTAAGTFNFTVTVTDSATNVAQIRGHAVVRAA
jgi:hypothetical protein